MSPKFKVLKRIARALKPRCVRKSKDKRPDVQPSAESKSCHKHPAESTFPIEIFELIIDLVWPDSDALLACALTCRAWLQRSRYNLFYSVDLHNCEHLNHLCRLLDGSPCLGTIVRELGIVPYRTQSQVLGEFPHELGGRLSRVSRLRIDINRDYYPFIAEDYFQCLGQFSSVTTLDIRRIRFPMLHDFAQLVCSFPRLTDLSCCAVTWTRKSYDREAFKPFEHSLALEHLHMKNVDWSAELVEWLLSVTSVARLESISLPAITVRDVEHVSKLLDAAGPSLRHLEIGILPGKATLVGTYPRLVHNTSLASVHLDLHEGGNWASGLLSQATSQNISLVTLSVPARMKAAKLKHYRCPEIDGALSLPQFTKLQKLVFQLNADATQMAKSDANIRRLQSDIPLWFPLSGAKNRLAFQAGNGGNSKSPVACPQFIWARTGALLSRLLQYIENYIAKSVNPLL
ncbi:hypothetical protein WOLCODRAFT_102847 [Wolfiporia cocos MD-104 SS10]|uniref:F-box domain-containing protein n=1 Tax=Wolfiporia cocos (strain MD-104) TaxID=742152 RepID=A0A2H3K3H2_WOLCO|nr:hypothetical protein WOLCODRAFT_102847 [Wolfiporia cocos MD-104 SS10]